MENLLFNGRRFSCLQIGEAGFFVQRRCSGESGRCHPFRQACIRIGTLFRFIVEGKAGDVPEILTFSGQERDRSSEAFSLEFCQCELINETGVINSRVKSCVRKVSEGQDSKSLTCNKFQGAY